MSEAVCRRAVVRGRVQGVFFRASCRDEAERLGVAGWIRNRPDGAVEALVEGDAAQVLAMLRWLERGPDQAVVTALDVSEEAVTGRRGFDVR